MIPFLVIEPAKNEYRVLKTLRRHQDPRISGLGETLKIYTPGNERISPFRVNPLEIAPGISRYEHIENVLACFTAAFGMPGPVYPLLGEALEQVYEDFPDPSEPPVLADLHITARRVLEMKRYDHETTSNIRAALEVRLGILTRRAIGQVFQCRNSIPEMHQLMTTPTILELSYLPPSPACLLALFILMLRREYIKISHKPGGHLQHVLVIEEAHNIVGRDTNAVPSEEIANPKAFSAEFVSRMLAEDRASGCAIIIVDQNPSSVAPQVIKNTTTKLAFRQTAKDDREEIGASMLFGEIETRDIASLNTGQAFFLTEGYHGPRRIQTIDLNSSLGLGPAPAQEEILALIKDDGWYVEARESRTVSELARLKEAIDELDDERARVIRDFASLRASHAHVPANPSRTSGHDGRISSLAARIQTLRERLNSAYDSFLTGPYRLFQAGDLSSCKLNYPAARELFDLLVRRLKDVTFPDTRALLGMMDDLIRRCADSELERT